MTKTRIIEHIEKKGKQEIEITPSFVFYWWNIFNKVLFNNELPYPDRICEATSKDISGQITYKPWARKYKVMLELNSDELPTRRWFYTILIHEMAHVYTDIKYPKERAWHGDKFMLWEDAVNELGLPYSKSYSVDDFPDPTPAEAQ